MPQSSLCFRTCPSPVGTLVIAGDGRRIHAVRVAVGDPSSEIATDWRHTDSELGEAVDQFEAYFAGERRDFDLAFEQPGTPFQQEAWRALLDVPYGATTTYGDLARAIGRPQASRAVGMAMHRNRIAIAVPCHRVVGKSGSLNGYTGGLDVKRRLLELERGL